MYLMQKTLAVVLGLVLTGCGAWADSINADLSVKHTQADRDKDETDCEAKAGQARTDDRDAFMSRCMHGRGWKGHGLAHE